MAADIFEQLADVPVPKPPDRPTFDRAVHQRINSRLLVGQLLDLFLRGFAFGLLHFGRALVGAIRYSITGKYDRKQRDDFHDG